MTINKTLLNKTAQMIIDHANKECQLLSNEFASPEEFKQFVISFTIRSLMENCDMELPAAYDTVLGKGEYQRLSNECWNTLQAKQQAEPSNN